MPTQASPGVSTSCGAHAKVIAAPLGRENRMRPEDLILISVDDHVVEPRTVFEQHLPQQLKAQAPRVVRKRDGSDVWLFNGEQIINIGLNAVVGRPPEEYGMEPTSFDQLRPGTYDIHHRIRDMNANGVLASMCFPSFPGLCGAL